MVDPASVNFGNSIEVSNVVGSKEGSADIADETANAVNGEDVESVVDSEDELELSRVIGESRTKNTKGNGSPDRDVSCIKSANQVLYVCCELNSPDPGVMETRPATTPEQKPTVDHLRSSL